MMLYKLKAAEVVRIKGRRVALSTSERTQDPRVLPLITPKMTADRVPIDQNGHSSRPARVDLNGHTNGYQQQQPEIGPVFLMIELQPGEEITVDGMRLAWDFIHKGNHKGRPILKIDAPKVSHPVTNNGETARVNRREIMEATP